MAPDGSVTFRIVDYPESFNPSENGREPMSVVRPNLTDKQALKNE